MWTQACRDTNSERTPPLHPSSRELMRPQASNHLGLEAQGSRWLTRGQGQGLSTSEAGLSEEGPWDHMSRAKGRLHPRRGRGLRGSFFCP